MPADDAGPTLLCKRCGMKPAGPTHFLCHDCHAADLSDLIGKILPGTSLYVAWRPPRPRYGYGPACDPGHYVLIRPSPTPTVLGKGDAALAGFGTEYSTPIYLRHRLRVVVRRLQERGTL